MLKRSELRDTIRIFWNKITLSERASGRPQVVAQRRGLSLQSGSCSCFYLVIPSAVEGSAFSFVVDLRRHSERSEESLFGFTVASVLLWLRFCCGFGFAVASVLLLLRFCCCFGFAVASVLLWLRFCCGLLFTVAADFSPPSFLLRCHPERASGRPQVVAQRRGLSLQSGSCSCFYLVIPSAVEGSAFSFVVDLRRHSERSEESLFGFAVASVLLLLAFHRSGGLQSAIFSFALSSRARRARARSRRSSIFAVSS